jgi:hypothetical protein
MAYGQNRPEQGVASGRNNSHGTGPAPMNTAQVICLSLGLNGCPAKTLKVVQ